MYKIIHQLVNVEFSSMFSFNTKQTRDNSYKLNVKYARVNCIKYSFAGRMGVTRGEGGIRSPPLF